MSRLWVAGHLLFLSAEDIREGRISMIPVLELGLTGLFRIVYMKGSAQWIPGILILCLGYVSKEKIGYGDGWLLLALGMWLDLYELLLMLELGIVCCIIYAAVSGKKELPFVPFLTAAYLLKGMKVI